MGMKPRQSDELESAVRAFEKGRRSAPEPRARRWPIAFATAAGVAALVAGYALFPAGEVETPIAREEARPEATPAPSTVEGIASRLEADVRNGEVDQEALNAFALDMAAVLAIGDEPPKREPPDFRDARRLDRIPIKSGSLSDTMPGDILMPPGSRIFVSSDTPYGDAVSNINTPLPTEESRHYYRSSLEEVGFEVTSDRTLNDGSWEIVASRQDGTMKINGTSAGGSTRSYFFFTPR